MLSPERLPKLPSCFWKLQAFMSLTMKCDWNRVVNCFSAVQTKTHSNLASILGLLGLNSKRCQLVQNHPLYIHKTHIWYSQSATACHLVLFENDPILSKHFIPPLKHFICHFAFICLMFSNALKFLIKRKCEIIERCFFPDVRQHYINPEIIYSFHMYSAQLFVIQFLPLLTHIPWPGNSEATSCSILSSSQTSLPERGVYFPKGGLMGKK